MEPNREYQFANLNEKDVEQVNQIQQKLSRDGKEIVLIAYEKKTEAVD